uniref:Uncharacterized protein n=1 Tax=Aureoumbra lagunensis TaxID=44058 RepID=A0A6S8A7R9_9STRA|mmetsp:Transcript_16617/g.24964  ORF Transcript_16617/g.24964 Transcript_16617/m.24964 type:complete len:1543 (+) Transcript_16617:57-4685(+)
MSSGSRRSVSQRLMRAPAVGIGTKIWLEVSDKERMYVSAKVVRQENTVIICEDEEGNERTFDMGFGELYIQNEEKNYEDMTAMQHLHEPGMLENVRCRILQTKKQPYTYMGTVLVAMNPLEPVSQPTVNEYAGSSFGSIPPHPYAVAELAFARLGDPGPNAKNQACIVSGESGAGKTESSKIVVRYLSERSGGASDLAQKVKATSPVLEAFGNAATTRNPNSSRFGKFLKLLFDCSDKSQSAQLVGGELETYLLEKSRVARQSPGESNFHALHMVCTDRKDALCGGTAPLRYIPRQVQVYGRDDKPKYPHVQVAVDAVLLGNSQDSEQVWRLLGAVLALGDMDISGDDHQSFIDPGSAAIMRLSTCLAFDSADQQGRAKLCKLLTHRIVATRGEIIATPRDAKNARLAADALARNMYAQCFQGLVSKCNAALGSQAAKSQKIKFIGILDVFGFEQFSVNVFDTLLINFANECLQQHFCDAIFEAELRLFEEEGIDTPEITAPPDSSATIELLAGRSASAPGIIRILDAQAIAGGKSSADSDAAFLAKVHSTHGRHASLARTHPKDKRTQFAIHHYADAVAYTVIGVDSWTEANVDTVPEGLAEIIQIHAGHGFARDALCAISISTPDSASKSATSKKKRQTSVAAGFASSMTKLRETLSATDSAFIRCVKPTPKMIPGQVDEKSCCAQLRALGLLAACEVLKVGLPTRVAYDDIFKKLPPSAITILQGEEKETIVAVALAAFEVPTEAYRLGRTRVFFPASAMGVIHKLLAFDPQQDRERYAVIEQRLKQAKENAGQARKCAKEARDFFRMAEADAQRADDALREFQQQREASATISGDDSAPLHRLASASGAKRAADLAERCASDAERFAADSAKLVAASSDISEAKQFSTDAAQAAIKARTAANKAKVLYNDIEPRATTGDAARVKAWETASELGDLSKSGVLGQCSAAADAAVKAAARLQLDNAQKSRDLAQNLAREAARQAQEVGRMLEVAKKAEEGVVGQAHELANAETQAAKACDIARTAYDALRQHCVDKALPQAQEKKSNSSTRRPIASVRISSGERAAVPSMRSGLPVTQEDEILTIEEAAPGIESPLPSGEERTPPGWEAHWDDNYGLYYYFNTVSGETQWEPPTRPARSSTQIDASTVAAALERNSDAPSWLPAPEEDYSSQVQKRTSVKRRSSFGSVAEQPPPPQHRAAAYSASAMAELATQRREGYLMKQGKWTSRWKPRWFVLEDSYLEYFEKKQHAYGRGGDKKQGKSKAEKLMRLEAKSITSFTDTENCFCVSTGSVSWFLVAPNEREMAEWISHINAHILSLRNDISNTDTGTDIARASFGSGGSSSSDFFEYARIAPDLDFVQVRTHASPGAPLTGQRLRPGDVVEITRKLELQGSTYVRLADFGWAPWLDPDASRPCFIPLEGGNASVPESLDPGKPAKFRLFKGTLPVPLLRGPTHYGQAHGESAIQGEIFEFIAQYTHAATPEPGFERDAYATFFKLSDGRGWAPLKDPNPPHRFLFEKVSAKASETQSRASTRRFSRFLG